MVALTVLGIGNILMQDEGVGVRLMEAVRDARAWPAEAEFIDGGVGGLNLLNVIESAGQLVVFDAADMGLAPGQWRIFRPEDVAPDRSDGRLSMHDVPFLETLELCRRFSRCPPTVLLAVQPKSVDYGRQISAELQAVFPDLLAAGVRLLADALHGRGQS
jgi:hydrogenase maturation protease